MRSIITMCFLFYYFTSNGQLLKTPNLYYSTLTKEIGEVSKYRKILIYHFDYCSPYSYCNYPRKIKKIILKLNPAKDLLIVDTLNNSDIPAYIMNLNFKYRFLNRITSQKKGLFSDRPLLLIPRRKKVKEL